MKQLLFLLLFPCLAMAQYQGNGNQKITLGEQTTADGLVYRGLAADTTRKPSVDTMAFILLDTNTNIIWQYKKAVNNAWTRVGGSISSGVTGVLPVANGGTNASTFTAGSVVFAGASGTSLTQDNSNLFWNNSTKRLGLGTNNPGYQIEVKSSSPIIGLIGEDDQPIYNALHYSNINTRSGRLSFYRSGGSINSKSTVLNNYPIGQAVFTGFNGTDDNDAGARFIAYADADWSDGSTPSRLVFETTPSGSGNTVARFTIKSSGNVGIGQTTPTALLHLKAGTATASTAPLKFTSGVNLTTAEAGAMEFNGTNLFFSPSTTRHTVNHGLTGSATLNFLSTNAQNSRDMTIAVTGAADGDVVSLGVPNAAVNANTCYTAWVSAANTVTVRFNNYSSGTVDPASASFKVFVTK